LLRDHPSMTSAPATTSSREGNHATLATALDPRNNSLNALRLAFAGLVIVSHAWPIGGFGPDPELGKVGLGTWAVAGFFAISGYLIAASRLRSGLGPFLWRRCLRILPGLWACLLVIAFVFAPIAAAVEHGPDHILSSGLLTFVGSNGLLNHVEGIGGTLSNVPYAGSWDGSLWTLFYEFACYLILGAVFALPVVRRRPERCLWALFGISLAITFAVYELHRSVPFRVSWLAYLGTYFWAGALLFVYAQRVRVNLVVPFAAFATLAVACVTGHVEILSAIPLAFLVLWLGAVLPLQRIGRKNDVSYGVYIYAFPVQQLLVLAGANALGLTAYILLAIVGTIPLAVASWFVIERPAIGLKRYSPTAFLPARLKPKPELRLEPAEVPATTPS
jgi:peptidoglycan/LPS O-acetylase OafA/YrhL